MKRVLFNKKQNFDLDRFKTTKKERRKPTVVEAARALLGDMKAADESPTHYNSYFALLEALKEKK